jgi:hypothetical protein
MESVATFPFGSKAIMDVHVQNLSKVVDLTQKWNKQKWFNSEHAEF